MKSVKVSICNVTTFERICKVITFALHSFLNIRMKIMQFGFSWKNLIYLISKKAIQSLFLYAALYIFYLFLNKILFLSMYPIKNL